jgi:hypothetical protein
VKEARRGENNLGIPFFESMVSDHAGDPGANSKRAKRKAMLSTIWMCTQE